MSHDQFINVFHRVFNCTSEGKEIGERILAVCQGKRRAAEYVLEFCTLAAENGWNKSAFKAVFRRVLNEMVHKEMACRDDEVTLDSLINHTFILTISYE